MFRYLSALAISMAATFVACQAKAEKVIVYQEGQLVVPQDVAAVLGQTRSIRLLDEAPARTAATTTTTANVATVATAPASALSLPVRFAFDSADILPAARTQLDALARGIKLLGPDRTITVEGHTDAVGEGAYNLELSRARARAVRDYLVQQHGLDAARLKTVGY